MNKKGFTLVELLAVLVLIILIMLLVIPNLKNLFNTNSKQQYESYEDMMVEYAKTYPNYEDYEYICLEDLGISKINQKNKCNGFVKINNSKIKPYLYCLNQGLDEVYKTKDYDKDTPACFGIVDTSLSMISTINDTNSVYNSGTWISGENYVTLSYKTLSNMEKVYTKDINNNTLSCNLEEKGNNIYGCSIIINESGIYESYGILSGNNVYSEKIEVNVDKEAPTFDLYDEKNVLISTSNQVVIETNLEEDNLTIINNILNLNDSGSGIKEIKYSFESNSNENYINLSENNLKITKTLSPGTYNLIVIATDNVGNTTKKEVKYILHEKSIELCANFHINGALKINESEDDLRLCCYSTDKISCDITTPTITPIEGFETVGWSDDGEVLTSANYEEAQVVTLLSNKDDIIEGENQEEELNNEQNFYAITRKPNPSIYQVTFNPNGATSFEIDGTSYTESTQFKCGSGYIYNGDETINSCTFILPSITRTGGTAYGWDLDLENQGTPEYLQGAEFEVTDDIELFAITSKDITLSFNGNISKTAQVGSDSLSSMSETKTIWNGEGIMFNIPSYTDANLCRTQGGSEKYHGYKLLGLNRSQTGTKVEYCFSDQIYLEESKTLYAVWQDVYAKGTSKVSSGLIIRKGQGTSYSKLATIPEGGTIYLKSSSYKCADGHPWYPIIYGSTTGYSSGAANCSAGLKNFSISSTPKANSCSYTYSCTSNNKLLSITPSDVYLNVTPNEAKRKLTQTLTIDNQCGSISSATVADTSIISATKAGVITAKEGSVAENQTKTTTVTYTTKYGCSEKVNVTVKNTEATAPEISISISGDSSTCSNSYLKGAKATVKCVSDLPITSYSAKIGSTSYSATTSGNTKTSTISLSSTGSKTIKVTCANSEGSTTKSKSVSIKVRNAASTCGCSTYYTASTAGSTCSRCASWSFAWNGSYSGASKQSNYCMYSSANGKQYKVTYINYTTSDTGRYYADTKTYRCSSFKCKTYKTCCHT